MAERKILPMNDQLIGCELRQFRDKKPSKVVIVPVDRRRRTHQGEREANYRNWKLNTGCNVIPYGDHARNIITEFGIFGGGGGGKVEQAVKEVNEWIEMASTKSSESSAWSKIKAYDPTKFGYDTLRERKEQYRELFKGPLPEDSTDMFRVVLRWPEDLLKADPAINPKDVFGTDLKGLDPVRTGEEVFVLPIDNHQFEILGYQAKHVDSAEQRCINMIQKVQMQVYGAKYPIHIILDETEGIDVRLEAAENWWPNRTTHRIVPRMIPHPMMNPPGSFRVDGMHATQLSVMQHNLQLALEAIRFDKAHYDFCIRFGCLALRHDERLMPDSRIGTTHEKGSFLQAVNGIIKCEAKKWAMDDEDGEELLDRLFAAEDLLEPTRSADYFGYTPETLGDTKPIFRGTWVFADPNARRTAVTQGPEPLVVIRIDWTDDEDGLYEKGTPQYYRPPPGQSAPEEHMDLKLLELMEGKAWQFSLESLVPIRRDTVSPALQDFAKRVSMNSSYDIHSKRPFVKAAQLNSMLKLKHSRLDKIYNFGIKDTCYKVELLAMWYPQQPVPCWGLNVRHKAWANHLAELEDLRTGEVARWGDVITAFLPDDGGMPTLERESGRAEPLRSTANEAPPRPGMYLLADKLMALSKIINDTGGVPVFQPEMPAQQPEKNLLD